MRAGPTWRTPRARVRALGASRHGANTWIAERVSSIALVPLGLWAVWAVLAVAPYGYAGAIDLLHNPFHATMAVLFAAVSFHHTQLGMRVIIEDYVASHGPRVFWLLVNAGACLLGGALVVFSILRVALGAGAY